MCFSPEASFAAGAVLLPAGMYCVAVAWRKQPSYLGLAVVPLLFSFQQVAEGLVWLGLERGNQSLVHAAALAFLAVALGTWPFWAPFSVLLIEKQPRVRRQLAALAIFGLALGGILYLPLLWNAESWLRVGVAGHSLHYNPAGLPAFTLAPHYWWDLGYLAAVLLPFFLLSSPGRLAEFRLLLLLSVVLSVAAFSHALLSVWCFFAAILSVQLCRVFARLGEPG